MKKIVYGILATLSGLVLLFSYRTSHVENVTPLAAETASSSSSTSSDSGAGTGGGAGTSGSGAASDSGAGSGSSGTATGSTGATSGSSDVTSLADGTFTGDTVNTRFGPVQVQITVAGGAITDVQVPEYPSGNPRDRQINERALPVLVSETTEAQSADIDMVSGATYTSEGYRESLQSAIDQARS